MTFFDTLTQRNSRFAAEEFASGLKMMPREKTIIIGCVDPRVDPANVFQLDLGDAVIIRNVGGRLNPSTLESLAVLRTVIQSAGQDIGPGWNLIVMHHTNCGIINCYHADPDGLARHLGVTTPQLEDLAITDPFKAVAIDVARLKADRDLPGGSMVSGVVYDVANGLIDVVVPPGLLRSDVEA